MVVPVNQRLNAQQITLLTQVGQALTGGNVNQAIARVDAFQGGDGNAAVNNDAELTALAQIATARIPAGAANRNELVNAQRQILLNLPQLVPNAANRDRLMGLIATQGTANNLLASNPVINAQGGWYLNNNNTEFNVGANARQNLIQNLGGTSLAANDPRLTNQPEGWQRSLRQNLHRAWTNDGPGRQFLSTNEYAALYFRAKEEYQQQNGGNFNEQEFTQQFNNTFMTSVREDTNFPPQLIAAQASMALCRSRFTGAGSEELTRCLAGTNRTLWSNVIQRNIGNYPPGSILHVERSGNPRHGSMVTFVNRDGQVETVWTPPTQGIVFALGGQGVEGVNNGGGFGGVPAVPPPAPAS